MQALDEIGQAQNILTQAVCLGKRVGRKLPRRGLRPSVRAALGARESERVLALAAFLPRKEAALVGEVLGAGRSMTEVSRLLGVPATTVRRRVRAILLRMRDPAFGFVAARRIAAAAEEPVRRRGRHDLDDVVARAAAARGARWPAEWAGARRVAAEMCVLQGASLRRAAARTGEPIGALRLQLDMLRELGREWRASAGAECAAREGGRGGAG